MSDYGQEGIGVAHDYTRQERIVIDVWVDFGDAWSFLGVSRLLKAIEGLWGQNVDIDLHSYVGHGSAVSDDDAVRLASLASKEGMDLDPHVLVNGVSQEVRWEAHRIMQAVKLGAVQGQTSHLVSKETAHPHALRAGARAGLEIGQSMQRVLLGRQSQLGDRSQQRDERSASSRAFSSHNSHIAEKNSEITVKNSENDPWVAADIFPLLGPVFSSEISDTIPQLPASRHDFLATIEASIRQDMANARRLRIRGLPLIVVAGRFMVTGAQSPTVCRQLIADAREAIRDHDTAEGVIRIDL